MTTQIFDKNLAPVSEKETTQPATAHVTYARVKYFSHSGTLPKSEVITMPQIFNM